jgi:outer membrane protein TolC
LGKPINNEYETAENLSYQEKKLDYDTLKTKSFSRNPGLKMKIIAATLAKKGIRLAKSDRIPNPTVGLIVSKEESNSKPLGASLGFSIPVWYRNSGEAKEKETELQQAENDVDYFKKQLELDIYTAYIEAGSAARQVEVLKKNVNETIEIQNLIDLQYREGKADFLTYLDNLKTVRNVKLNYYETITDYETKLALMERIINEDLTR